MPEEDTGDIGPTIGELLKLDTLKTALTDEDPEEDPALEDEDPEISNDKDKDEPSKDKGDEEDEPSLKYASHEEAEKAYAEAERAMHEANTRAAAAEKAYAELKAPEPEKPADPFVEIASKYAEKMKGLDEADPELRKKAMEILVEQSLEVAKLQAEQGSKAATSKRLDAKQKVAHVRASLKSAGLEKFEDEFFAIAGSVPKDITEFNPAVDWGIERVKELIAKFSGIQEAKDKDKDAKEKESFALGGVGRHKVSSKAGDSDEDEELPETLGESMKALRETRKIK